jgi:hypothetical protein
MPGDNLIRGLQLPDLELTSSFYRKERGTNRLEAKKTSAMEASSWLLCSRLTRRGDSHDVAHRGPESR